MPRPKPKNIVKKCVICDKDFDTVDTYRGVGRNKLVLLNVLES